MADFQYASCGHRPQDAQVCACKGKDGTDRDLFLLHMMCVMLRQETQKWTLWIGLAKSRWGMIQEYVQALPPSGLLGFEPEPLLTPPQLFTKQDVPLDYGFRSYYGSDPEHFKAGA